MIDAGLHHRPSKTDLLSGITRVRVAAIFPTSVMHHEGVVRDLLSRQFTYEDDKGIIRYVFYENADWEIISDGKGRKEKE